MISVNLIISAAPYTNEDAISNTINYICRLNNENIFFYGSWPPTKESAIRLFESLHSSDSHVTSPQKVQHFMITFENCNNVTFVNEIANSVALLFAPAYPICFALHDDTEHMHVHFILSTTCVVPNQPPLVDEHWKKAVLSIQSFIKNTMNFDLSTKYKYNDTSKNPDDVIWR